LGVEDLLKNIGPGLVSTAIVSGIRAVVNNSLAEVRPGQVVKAIESNTSLWEVAGGKMTAYASKIPPTFIQTGRPMYLKAIADYGNATELVMSWMKEDNPVIYSLIINTPGGQAWFDEQIRDVCQKFGLEYSAGE